MTTYLQNFDPRLKILLGLGLGISVWHSGPLGLGLHFVLLLCLALLPGLRPAMARGPRQVLSFAGLWALAVVALRLVDGLRFSAALAEAGVLGLRLGTLMLLGLVLAASSSPRSLGLGWAALLRPVLRQRAWTVALALALMLDYLPLVLRVLGQVRQTVRRRGAGLSLFSKMSLLAAAGVRAVGLTTWRRATALAARGLDHPGAWRADFALNSAQVMVFFGALVASWAVGSF